MQSVSTLIVGAIALLIGVVLIGPIVSSVSGLTTEARCATPGARVTPLVGGSLVADAQNTVIPVGVNYPAGNYRPAGTLCVIAPPPLVMMATEGMTIGPSTSPDYSEVYAIAGAPGASLGGELGGADNAATRSLAILIPLIFVAAIVTVPLTMVWGKMRGAV